MRVLFDTNVLLDVLLDSDPHVQPATRLMGLLERGRLQGLLGATTVTTIHYLVRKVLGKPRAAAITRRLLSLFEIAPVNRSVLDEALDRGWEDLENAVLQEAGIAYGVDGIVTRDKGDFRRSTRPVYSPEELVGILSVAE